MHIYISVLFIGSVLSFFFFFTHVSEINFFYQFISHVLAWSSFSKNSSTKAGSLICWYCRSMILHFGPSWDTCVLSLLPLAVDSKQLYAFVNLHNHLYIRCNLFWQNIKFSFKVALICFLKIEHFLIQSLRRAHVAHIIYRDWFMLIVWEWRHHCLNGSLKILT